MAYNYEFTLTAVNPTVFSPQFYSPEMTFPEYTDDDKPSYYTFTSEHLNELTDAQEVWARGKFLLAMFKGAHIITYEPVLDNYRAANLNLIRLYRGDSDITPSNSIHIVPSRTFGTLNTIPLANADEWIANNPVSGMIQAAVNDEKAQNILLQIGFGIDWINLYAILDSIKFYAGQQGFKDILRVAGYTEKQVKAFKGTVNNFGLLSVDSRHGDLGRGIPNDTMDLIEARSLILALARGYFNVIHQIN
ncbi:hypothetical protein [Pedobacter suwonensis]|uniref:hypothetical protein n=1 Tax=Pedobacter suwonensis TaxID=332999 RepID=UPI0036AA58D6